MAPPRTPNRLKQKRSNRFGAALDATTRTLRRTLAMPPLRRFNPSSTIEGRAIQAWLILVSRAMNRQTITYQGLSMLMYPREAPGVLDKILGRILTYCKKNDLPLLSVIVVNKERGTPGQAEKLYPELDGERERVYGCNWYDICPPTEEDFTKKETSSE